MLVPVVTADANAGFVEFSYAGPSAIHGSFIGSCAASGVLLKPGGLDIQTEGGRLEIRHTRVNYTLVSPESNPVPVRVPDRQWVEERDIPAGRIRLDWGSDGLATVLPPEPPNGTHPATLPATLHLTQADLSSVRWNLAAPAESYWVTNDEGTPVVRVAQFQDWNRKVSFQGEAWTEGPVVLYLRATTLSAAVGPWRMDPWITEEFNATTPLVARQTLRFTDAFLYLDAKRLPLPSSGELVCGALDGTIHGSFAADQAAGSARLYGETLTFDAKVLGLEGTFQIDERPEDLPLAAESRGKMAAQARGDIRALGLDFAGVVEGEVPVPLRVAGVGGILVGLGFALWKGWGSIVGVFYSRFGRDRALDNGNRDMIYQAIVQNPGVDLVRLQTLTPFHLSTVAYHVKVLRRVGLVERIRHGHSTRFVSRDHPVNRVRVLATHDERLAFILERLGGSALPLRDLVRAFMVRFEVTRQAAYIAINLAVEQNLARRLGTGREVVIQCAS